MAAAEYAASRPSYPPQLFDAIEEVIRRAQAARQKVGTTRIRIC